MKRKVWTTLTCVLILVLLSIAGYVFDRISYSKPFAYFEVKPRSDTTLTIGIIGDSWVAWGVLDSALHAELLKKGLQNKVLSSGHPGKMSKVIYQNIFEPTENKFSSKLIIQNQPDYCIVIAGTNDLIAQIGADNYAHHICQIIRTLLHYKIQPVVVPAPEFEVEETIDSLDIVSRYRNKLFAYFDANGEINNIQMYRQALSDSLRVNKLSNSVLWIDYDKVCKDYRQCTELYKNTSHLSRLGNEKLCRVIADELYRAEQTR